jgi:glutamate dehydrogenase
MITGGPDGDLGGNEIQCYRGKICLVIDGGSILFDPKGLDRTALMKIAFMRHTSPRANSLAFPLDKLSPQGFRVAVTDKNITLPNGRRVDDGRVFHRTFLSDPANREIISQADIAAFIPCGGFKDTINQGNVAVFSALFKELRFIVEGANVFFDDAARRYIATSTPIKQIKDTTANKGGVFSSSIAEVLTGFLFEEEYEEKLLNDTGTRWALIRDIMTLVDNNARAETSMLIQIHETDPAVPLFVLSEQTSEAIFSLQLLFEARIEQLLEDEDTVWHVMENYIPAIIIKKIGRKGIMDLLNSDALQAYRNAIITKKLSSMAFYRFGLSWEAFVAEIKTNFSEGVKSIALPMN